MTAAEPVRAVQHSGALQCALSAAAKACASYRLGATRIGDDALLAASEMVPVAFPAGSPAALSLAAVLDAVETIGDAAEFAGIIGQLAGGER